MTYHTVVKKITDLLVERGVVFKTFEHEPVRTSEEATQARPEYSLHQGAKAMIIKIKPARDGKEFVMLVFPADLKFDGKKVKAATGAKDLRFATEEEVSAVTGGIQIGGVPPFGNLFGLEVFADPALFGNEEMIFNAGDRSFSIAMRSEDYKKIVNPTVVEIAKNVPVM
jgi:Ala-tRNA(Pro) deacylase